MRSRIVDQYLTTQICNNAQNQIIYRTETAPHRNSPGLPTLTSSTGALIGGMGSGNVNNVGSIGIGVTLMPNASSSLASVGGSHLQVTGGNQGVGPQTSPQAPTYVNL